MFQRLKRKLISNVQSWLLKEDAIHSMSLSDFDRIRFEVRPCDVLLIEGRSRVSQAIRSITQSPWSHACLYIGRLHDIDDVVLRKAVVDYFQGEPEEQLVIEGMLGQGTIISPLRTYKSEHIRICRPRGISRSDAQKVIGYGIKRLGKDYDVRQIVDLALFLLPWGILPVKWRTRLFETNAGSDSKTVCSTLIADAFHSVGFPILPLIIEHEEKGLELIQRNTRLFTPSDFDYSPFFEIIKYPIVKSVEGGIYRDLPWNNELVSQHGSTVIHTSAKPVLSPLQKKEPHGPGNDF